MPAPAGGVRCDRGRGGTTLAVRAGQRRDCVHPIMTVRRIVPDGRESSKCLKLIKPCPSRYRISFAVRVVLS
ncbi:MAG: hypothetical protein LC799_27450, partial [Actinobacteria bacterium]|nr:hypothetical protein [Actinomycetota bacterium]